MDQDAKTFARTLRELGEQLDGSRGEEMVLVRTKVGSEKGVATYLPEIMTAAAAKKNKAKVLWNIPATNTLEPVPELSSVEIYYQGKFLATCEKPTDALFWTDSSIEKFVYGYYEQLRIFPDLYKLLRSQLEDASQRSLIIAVKHDNPSHPFAIGVPDSGSSVKYLVADEGMVRANGGSAWFTPGQFAVLFPLRTVAAGGAMKKAAGRARKVTAKKGRKRTK